MAQIDDVDSEGEGDGDDHEEIDDGYDDRWDIREDPAEAAERLQGGLQSGSRYASVDALLDGIQGLTPVEAEEQIRGFLLGARGSASDADTLAILLKAFRAERDGALEGYQPWDNTASYCKRLTGLCDMNFVATSGSEPGEYMEFPASVVAFVYAECGRTLALSGELQKAREHLSKALSVFAIVPESGEDALSVVQQKAAARAAHARVLWKLGHPKPAEKEYLQALQLYMPLPPSEDIAHLITEYCDVLAELGDNCFIAPDFVYDLAREKYGEGSEHHLRALREVADVCLAVGHPGDAAPALEQRAQCLRAQCTRGGPGGGGKGYPSGRGARRSPGAMLQAEAEIAEDEAAQAFEHAAAKALEAGDLEAVAHAWEEALRLREASGGPDSQVVSEMRSALAAIRMALPNAAGKPGQALERVAEPDEVEHQKPEEEPDNWEDRDEDEAQEPPREVAAPSAETQAVKPAKAVSLTNAGGPLRPAWARK